MSKVIVVTRPSYDPCTKYLFYWSTLYIALAKTKSYTVLDLKEKRANKKELTSAIQKMNPHLICINGHGNNSVVVGHDSEVLIALHDNESLVKNTVVSILACNSGKELGPSCIENGATALIAYDEEFVFSYNNRMTSRPLSDETAKLFLEPANEVIHSLLKGHSIKEAFEKSQLLYRRNIQKLLGSNSAELIRYLLWDMKHQVCLGETNAYI